MTSPAWETITRTVDNLDRPLDRTYAWASAVLDLAAAEIGQTPATEQSDAIWAYGSMQAVKSSLESAGAHPIHLYAGKIDRDTARALLIAALRQLITSTDAVPSPTPEEFTALGDALDFAVDSYVALTGELPS